MIKVIRGNAPYNQYKVTPLYGGYRKQYIIRFAKSYDFFKWEETVIKPMLGNKYLIEITETEWVRDLDGLLNRLEEFMEHPYIDIIWYPEESRIENHTTKLEVIDLRKTYKEDVTYTAMRDFPQTPPDVIEHLLTQVQYRWKTYEMYRDIFLEKHGTQLTTNIVNSTVEVDDIKTAYEIFKMIILKERYAIHNYYKLQKRYSKRWTKSYLIREVDKIIKYKVQIANRKKTLTDLKKDKKMAKYFFIINRMSIPHLQIFRLIIEDTLGVEIWLNYTPRMIYENYLVDKLYGGN